MNEPGMGGGGGRTQQVLVWVFSKRQKGACFATPEAQLAVCNTANARATRKRFGERASGSGALGSHPAPGYLVIPSLWKGCFLRAGPRQAGMDFVSGNEQQTWSGSAEAPWRTARTVARNASWVLAKLRTLHRGIMVSPRPYFRHHLILIRASPFAAGNSAAADFPSPAPNALLDPLPAAPLLGVSLPLLLPLQLKNAWTNFL